jgi:hypothetical protein
MDNMDKDVPTSCSLCGCKAFQPQVEPDPDEMAALYGAETPGLRLARKVGQFLPRQPADDIALFGGSYGAHRCRIVINLPCVAA